MQHAIDLDRSHGSPLQRRQQHAPKRIAERYAKSPLKWLGDDGSQFVVVSVRNDGEL